MLCSGYSGHSVKVHPYYLQFKSRAYIQNMCTIEENPKCKVQVQNNCP